MNVLPIGRRRTAYPLRAVLVMSFLSTFLLCESTFAQVKRTNLADGVVKYEAPDSSREPSFWELFSALFQTSPPKMPFGRSFAFLVGVGSYRYLSPQLPYVHTDIEDMRRFLLEKSGFDVVYVAEDGVVTTGTIEDYMVNVLPKQVGPNDRLLFYYSGHGADIGGATGYMQFEEARQGVFDANQYLAITRTQEWSRLIPAKHALFLIDSCASGLGFEAKSGSSQPNQDLLSTLSGNGSRFVITAGTARDKAFEIDVSSTQGYSVFTHSFLEALRSNSEGYREKGFVVLDEVFADAKVRVARFSSTTGQKMTPRLWSIPRDEKDTGSFIFLNKDITGVKLTSSAKAELGISAKDASDNSLTNSSTPSDSVSTQVNRASAARQEADSSDAPRTQGQVVWPESSSVTAQANGFAFAVRSCKRRAEVLTCTGSASNAMEKSRLLDLNAQTEGVSSVVDSNGTQYPLVPPARGTIVFGASGRRQQLPRDIPITFTISIPKFSDATSVNILLSCWTDQPYEFFEVTLHDVPVAW